MDLKGWAWFFIGLFTFHNLSPMTVNVFVRTFILERIKPG